jgi:hypothetical protein
MQIVIQCAGSKQNGGWMHSLDGQRVLFVADPSQAPAGAGLHFAHPDDSSDRTGKSWRDVVADMNSGVEPSELVPTSDLYANGTYRDLVSTFSAGRVYILLAGWGLVRADYLIPNMTSRSAATPSHTSEGGGSALTTSHSCQHRPRAR